jgi:Domain of unknown function (DUF1906)
MKQIAWIAVAAAAMSVFFLREAGAQETANPASAYLGFDRNDYPGDAKLTLLRQTFSFAGFWLNHPPGAKMNTWMGKRGVLESAGFGFLILFDGRLLTELKTVSNAARLGKSDGQAAIAAAQREGFPAGAVIFLDQEEGGRMLPEQRTYIHTWVDRINVAGFRAGIYCSGIAAKEGAGVTVVTAEDIRQNAGGRKIVYWVANDACPPSPGCAFPRNPPKPADSGTSFAEVWQFAQSPKRPAFASACPKNCARNGNCYAPGADVASRLHLDLNTATSADPSQGRAR